MLTSVGFTILSHGSAEQLRRLVSALDREYQRPPIACHHDFGQAPLDTSAFGANVRFVQPHVATGWGRYSIVEALLAAIRLLYESSRGPDWFTHLSAADYPVMAGSKVVDLLASSRFDAFLDAREVLPGVAGSASTTGTLNSRLEHFSSKANLRMKQRFYLSREIWIPIIRTQPRLRLGRYTVRTPWRVGGVYEDFAPYYGDFWFTANSRVGRLLASPTKRHEVLQRHLRTRSVPDETYVQTVLMNEADLTIDLDNKRFADWNGGGAHPTFLVEEQLPQMLASGAFFARKFRAGSSVLDRIDSLL